MAHCSMAEQVLSLLLFVGVATMIFIGYRHKHNTNNNGEATV